MNESPHPPQHDARQQSEFITGTTSNPEAYQDPFDVYDDSDQGETEQSSPLVSALGERALDGASLMDDPAELDAEFSVVDQFDRAPQAVAVETQVRGFESPSPEQRAQIDYLKSVLAKPESIPEALKTEAGSELLRPLVNAYSFNEILKGYIDEDNLLPLPRTDMQDLEIEAKMLVDIYEPPSRLLEAAIPVFDEAKYAAIDRQQEIQNAHNAFTDAVREGDPDTLGQLAGELMELTQAISSSAEYDAVAQWPVSVLKSFQEYSKLLKSLEDVSRGASDSAWGALNDRQRNLNLHSGEFEYAASIVERNNQRHAAYDTIRQIPLRIADVGDYLPRPPVLSGAASR